MEYKRNPLITGLSSGEKVMKSHLILLVWPFIESDEDRPIITNQCVPCALTITTLMSGAMYTTRRKY